MVFFNFKRGVLGLAVVIAVGLCCGCDAFFCLYGNKEKCKDALRQSSWRIVSHGSLEHPSSGMVQMILKVAITHLVEKDELPTNLTTTVMSPSGVTVQSSVSVTGVIELRIAGPDDPPFQLRLSADNMEHDALVTLNWSQTSGIFSVDVEEDG